jgi:hypothetical protein
VGVSWRWRADGARNMEVSLFTGDCSNVGITYTVGAAAATAEHTAGVGNTAAGEAASSYSAAAVRIATAVGTLAAVKSVAAVWTAAALTSMGLLVLPLLLWALLLCNFAILLQS